MEIIIPIIILASLGLLFGLGLAVASRRFCVIVEPKLKEVLSFLPGANCGACGMPSCFAFGQALIKGEISLDSCRVIEESNKKKIAQILGITLGKEEKKVCVLHCKAGRKVKEKFRYNGLPDCIAANMVQGGNKDCSYGCLGFGTCVEVCPFSALSMSEEGLPLVDFEKCRGCGKCVEACPKGLFTLLPASKKVVVSCSSHDTAKETRAVCSVGCIGCGRCERVCPTGAIHVIDNLAVIDYEKCISCGECVKVCPTGAIVQIPSSMQTI